MALHKLHEARHVLLPNDEESFCVDCRLKKRLLINPDKATPTPNDSNFKQGPSSKTKVIKVALLITDHCHTVLSPFPAQRWVGASEEQASKAVLNIFSILKFA